MYNLHRVNKRNHYLSNWTIGCFYFERKRTVFGGVDYGWQRWLTGRGGKSLLIFFFPDTTVEHKNKLETRRALGSTLVRVFSAKAKKHKPCYLRDFLSLFFLIHLLLEQRGRTLKRRGKRKKEPLERKFCVSECALYAQCALWNFDMLNNLGCIAAYLFGCISFVVFDSPGLAVIMCRG